MQFIDLSKQLERIKDKIDGRIQNTLSSKSFIMGPDVVELESLLSDFCGAKHSVTCANGTDALLLALMALGIKQGDAVFVPSLTFAATAEMVPFVAATPILVDIDPKTYNLDPDSLERCIEHARQNNLNPACIIAVDLFGLPADYKKIQAIADRENILVIGDSAQGFGARYHNRFTGTLADITTTSFFPAKPLGCYGDGGALFTENTDIAEILHSLRFHGKGEHKYNNVRLGTNSRLDTLQAGILCEKLGIYADEIEARQRVADYYSNALENHIQTPYVPENTSSVWAQYTLRAETSEQREYIQSSLKERAIPTMIYYPRPLHQQTAYSSFPKDPRSMRQSELASQTVFSVPMHPYLEISEQDQIITALLQALKG